MASFMRKALQAAVSRRGKIPEVPLTRCSLCSRRTFVSPTTVLLEKKTMKLPSLGESISEVSLLLMIILAFDSIILT